MRVVLDVVRWFPERHSSRSVRKPVEQITCGGLADFERRALRFSEVQKAIISVQIDQVFTPGVDLIQHSVCCQAGASASDSLDA
jgi:hypothetical protein